LRPQCFQEARLVLCSPRNHVPAGAIFSSGEVVARPAEEEADPPWWLWIVIGWAGRCDYGSAQLERRAVVLDFELEAGRKHGGI
jgi:hypothetical protein